MVVTERNSGAYVSNELLSSDLPEIGKLYSTELLLN